MSSTVPTSNNALVVTDVTSSTVAVRMDADAARQKAREMFKQSEAICKNLASVSPIKAGDGVTFPIIVEKVGVNKKTEASTGESYNVRGIVGSLNKVRGAGPKGDHVLVPIHLSKIKALAEKGAVIGRPISRIDKKQIDYISISTGKSLMVFSGKAAVTAKSYAYVVMAEAFISMQLVPTDAKADRATLEIQAMIARANANGFDGTAKSVFVGPGNNGIMPASSSSDASDTSAAGAIPTWYTPTKYGKLFMPPPAIVAAYLDQSSTLMTMDERRCLELEFPELALNTGTLLPNYRFCMNWRCGTVIPVTNQEYVGQERDDFLALVKHNPEVERSLFELVRMRHAMLASGKSDYRDDAADDSFIVVSRGGDEFENVISQRVSDSAGNTPVALAVHYDLAQKRTNQCFSRITNCSRICLAFTATGCVWTPGKSWADEVSANRMYQLSLIGCGYEELLTPAIGLSSDPSAGVTKEKKLADWDTIHKKLVGGAKPATIIYVCRVDWNNTAKLEANFQTSSDTTTPITYSMCVDNMIVDMPEFLVNNTMPVTAIGAGIVLKLKVPAPEVVAAAIPTSVGSTTCLSEEPEKFAACIAAGCEFRVLTKKDIRTKHLDMITPELGTRMVSAEWSNPKVKVTGPLRVVEYDECGQVVNAKIQPDFVFDGNNDLRDATPNICSDFAYVFAIRPEIKASAARAGKSMEIFNEGGNYDKLGYPIITNAAADVSPMAAIDSHKRDHLSIDQAPVSTPDQTLVQTPVPVPVPVPIVVVAAAAAAATVSAEPVAPPPHKKHKTKQTE